MSDIVLNLGLVELGGNEIEIDDPEFKLTGYIFKFNSTQVEALKIRGYAMLRNMLTDLHNVEIRLFVNYPDMITLSVALFLIRTFSCKISKCHLLFDNGQVVTYI